MFKKAVDKQVKKIIASAIQAEEADDNAFTATIDAVIKKNSTTSQISATTVVKKKQDLTEREQEVADSQRADKLSFVMNKISLKTDMKYVTVHG